MEGAIQTMVKVFLKSSKGKESLGKKEFQNLVSSQLGNILTDTDSKEAIDNMGKGLDTDQDGKVGFEEFLKLVGYVACSLSEQRALAKDEPAQNSASAQVAQSTPNNEDQKPEANKEANPEVNEEVKAATTEVKVEANADAKAEVKVEAKAEGQTQPEAAKEAAVAAAGEAAAKAGEAAVKVEVKVEEAADKLPAAVKEEVEKKTEEAAS
ncbi:S100 calcium binding protein U [Archocentrus centrarchus]|uniref:S100 calcium binding protein U n=1 Tax=Archocentrus centrarchus TaxID=63155 RepID=UPI0011E9D4F0|nr:brain acid soluble protein 1-like [Archocentrus centrarchus]